MATTNRPLSPHLQIYRLPLLALLSITHRGTGVVLSIGAFLIPAVLYALISGPECYAHVQSLLTAWYGQIFLFLLSGSLVFHMLNGIRHLIWDTGYCLDIKSAETLSVVIIVLTFMLTAAIWLLAYLHYYGGGA